MGPNRHECDAVTIVEELRRRVIDWEKKHWNPYPWRIERTPYKVLIAEILLKRTTRQAVLREYPKFIVKFPSPQELNNAPTEKIAEELKHLGLYRQRAEHLKALAEALVKAYGGNVPNSWDGLVKLPGVGPYIAGAVLSFGYGKPAPVIDSNVMRLLGRLTGLKLGKAEEYLQLLWRLVPEKDHEYFNYGLIDLGFSVCRYGQPKCTDCPLSDLCVTQTENKEPSKAECLKEVYHAIYSEKL
ncbi:MAG: A/G-specific adenine glycosylase [Thermofilum sp.]|jgi:A/G-specific adenine glycosylase|nr:A/G-specific adenine glycosylase [Thermofilum sp.]